MNEELTTKDYIDAIWSDEKLTCASCGKTTKTFYAWITDGKLYWHPNCFIETVSKVCQKVLQIPESSPKD